MKSNKLNPKKQSTQKISSDFIVTKLLITAIVASLINIQPKAVFASPDLVAQTDRSNSELENFKRCDRALDFNPSDVRALLCRADFSVKLGNMQGALQDYSQALRLDPTNPEIYYQRAIIRNNIGDMQGADDDYTQIIKIIPSYQSIAPEYTKKYLTLAHTNRGLIRSKSITKKGKEAAVADFDAAIAITPNYDKPYLGRASTLSALADIVYTESGKLNLTSGGTRLSHWMRYNLDAESDYNQYLRYNPTDSKGYYERGRIRYQLGQLSNDVRHQYKKRNFIRDYLEPLGANIRLLRHRDDYKKLALADYNQAIKLNPDFVVAYYHRGIVYDDLGYTATALNDYEKVFRIDPNIFLNPNTFVTFDKRGVPQEQLLNENAALDDQRSLARA